MRGNRHPSPCRIPTYRQSAQSQLEPDRRPTNRPDAYGASTEDKASQRQPAQGQNTERESPQRDAAERDPTQREHGAEGNVTDCNPTLGDAATVLTIHHLSDSHVHER